MCRKIEYIIETLENLYQDPVPPLDHSDPYTLLIAVLLSARCTDERVNVVTKELYKIASTPQAMIQLSLTEIESYLRPLGLYKVKAAAVYNLSRILIDNYDGRVPSTMEELEKLPGVGHKTASVVLIQAFDTPAFPVDTHVHRLAARWGLSSLKNVIQTEKDLKELVPRNLWAKFHLQMIYYGREYCPAKKHSNEKCLICNYCNSTKNL